MRYWAPLIQIGANVQDFALIYWPKELHRISLKATSCASVMIYHPQNPSYHIPEAAKYSRGIEPNVLFLWGQTSYSRV